MAYQGRGIKYCSYACAGKAKTSSVTLSCDCCGKSFKRTPSNIFWAKERGHKSKFCSTHCLHKFCVGERSPVWIKDRTLVKSENRCLRYSIRMSDWRKSVFERDDYTCCCCGVRGHYLQAHHIKKFADHKELRFDVGNGITLCKRCHGRIRRREEDFEELFVEMLSSRGFLGKMVMNVELEQD